jgi:hypothetical protein
VVWCRAIAEQLKRSSGAFSGRRQVGAFDHKRSGPKVRNIESVGLVELVLRKARVSRPRVHSASAIATTNRRTGRLGTLSLYCSHRGHRAMSRRLPCPLSNHRRGTHWVAGQSLPVRGWHGGLRDRGSGLRRVWAGPRTQGRRHLRGLYFPSWRCYRARPRDDSRGELCVLRPVMLMAATASYRKHSADELW